jgi:hypothetical protein
LNRVRFRTRLAVALAAVAGSTAALAGPPYLTDDPVPTSTGHWEIYAFAAGEGRRSAVDADAGLDLNYGPVQDIQLTATLPLSLSHQPPEGWRAGTGDVELGIKYRLFNDEHAGFSAAIFPRAILPTSSLTNGEKVRVLLPLWLGKDFAGGTSIFGGGGYEFNPGPGNRDFWQAGAAVTHDFGKGVNGGLEIEREGPDSIGATAKTQIGAGTIVHLSGPASFLASGGPTWSGHRTGYHFYAALGFNF